MEEANASNCENNDVVLAGTINRGLTLVDFFQTDQYSQAISAEIADLMTCNVERVNAESEILAKFVQMIRIFDPVLKVLPFGSTEYGFNGSHTNRNILIDTRNSAKSATLLQDLFVKFIETSDFHHDFVSITKKDANRVQNEQLKMVHKSSRIECWLIFDKGIAVVDSAKLIKDFFTLMPICRELVAYIRAWQNVINRLALENGHSSFKFNTYIISILVIFFLQVKHKMPVVAEASSLAASIKTSTGISRDYKQEFDKMIMEFFQFYGRCYRINNHLISARIGRWQNQNLHDKQKHFTSEQKCLRDGIQQAPNNWNNCTMFVQDLLAVGLNIAAEISKESAYNFQNLCQILFESSKNSSSFDRGIKSSPSNWLIQTFQGQEVSKPKKKRTSSGEDQSEIDAKKSKQNNDEKVALKITDLIDDVMVNIFKRLSLADLLNYADSNTKLKEQAEHVYKQKHGSKLFIKNDVRGEPAVEVNIRGTVITNNLKMVLQTLRCFVRCIEDVDFDYKDADADSCKKIERYLADYCSKTLALHNVTSRALFNGIEKSLIGVKNLYLYDCNFNDGTPISNLCPNIEKLILERTSSSRVVEKHLPHLRMLSVDGVDEMIVKNLLRLNPQVDLLWIGSYYDAEFIRYVSKNLPEHAALHLNEFPEEFDQKFEVIDLNHLIMFTCGNQKPARYFPFSFDKLKFLQVNRLTLNENTLDCISKISILNSLWLRDWEGEESNMKKLLKCDNILSNVENVNFESNQQISVECILDFLNECKSIEMAKFPANGEIAAEIKAKLDEKWLIELKENTAIITLRE